MTPEQITTTLNALYGAAAQVTPPDAWQVETDQFRLLVLLSADQSWLRVLVPIVSFQEAQPYIAQLLAANFDTTQEGRYALHQDVLWGVFQHNRESLTIDDFIAAMQRLINLREQGLSVYFDDLVETRLRQIIQAAKRQGQSLKATLQSVERFYEEGLMGGLDQDAEVRQATLAAWRWQLERLWPEVES